MRRVGYLLPLAALLGAAALLGSGGAAAASPKVRIVEAKGPNFPVRTFVISLPHGSRLSIRNVSITENGTSVIEPSLTPASKTSKKTFGVVLVLDTSWSMRGKPLAAAIAAEQAFASQRNGNEQLGAIDFNRTATTVLPLTTSAAKITEALATQPAVATGTHIYDAVAKAEKMLETAAISSGSIVVLSDGADTGSARTIEQVAHAARGSNIRIYTVGLADKSYKPTTLKLLARAGGGQYAQGQASALAPLFGRLSQILSNEYLLQYKSLAQPNAKVHVEVAVSGLGASATDYRAPALAVTSVSRPTYKQSVGGRIWGSTITMIVLALFGAVVVALLAVALAQPRRSGLPKRMAEFVSIRDLQRDKGPSPAIAAALEQENAASATFWDRFKETLEIADIKATREQIVLGTAIGTVLTFGFIYAVTGSILWCLFALGVPYVVREWIIRTLRRRRYRFAEQLPDALEVIASALRSGQSLAGALAVVVEGASEPTKTELQRVVADEQLGIPIQDSLRIVAVRMASGDVEQLALVAELQREAGGNAAEVVERVAETVRERFDLRRLIQTLTMQGRMSRWIVSLLPVVIVLLLQLESPHYLHPLLATTGGRIMFGFAAAWAFAGSLVIKKIVEIEV